MKRRVPPGTGHPEHRQGAASVTLVGMPGSGKTAIGKILASRLGWKLVDTDDLLERLHGKPLQALIHEVGDATFRVLEEEAVLALAPAGPTVISTGGSVIYSEAAMSHLATLSAIVFIDATVDSIRSHIDAEAPRGIVGMGPGGLDELYRERLPLYRRHAVLTIETDSETPEEVAQHVLRELAGWLASK
jgi:shikimate kinase